MDENENLEHEYEQEYEHPSYPCASCAGGRRSLHHITYFAWHRSQLITVPNFPAWVCDLCGGRDYDMHAVSWLNMLLHSQERPSGQQPAAGHSAPPGF
jgi:YgiT-type zinc finger domain-containing protein